MIHTSFRLTISQALYMVTMAFIPGYNWWYRQQTWTRTINRHPIPLISMSEILGTPKGMEKNRKHSSRFLGDNVHHRDLMIFCLPATFNKYATVADLSWRYGSLVHMVHTKRKFKPADQRRWLNNHIVMLIYQMNPISSHGSWDDDLHKLASKHPFFRMWVKWMSVRI